MTQLPLDIHLTNEYRYQLVRETDLARLSHVRSALRAAAERAGRRCRSIAARSGSTRSTWARIRISMVQLNLTRRGAVERRAGRLPAVRARHARAADRGDVAKTDPREIVWLPLEVGAQQVVSAAGRANVVLRATTFTELPHRPGRLRRRGSRRRRRPTRAWCARPKPACATSRSAATASASSKKASIPRARSCSAAFITTPDSNIPVVPLGGIDYFNFDLLQHAASRRTSSSPAWSSPRTPRIRTSRTRARTSAPTSSASPCRPRNSHLSQRRRAEVGEAVKALPTRLSTLRAGHPFLQFGKVDFSLGVAHITYQRADDTAPSFVVPSDTFVHHARRSTRSTRAGATRHRLLRLQHAHEVEAVGQSRRVRSEPEDVHATSARSLGKSFYLPKFQRIGVERRLPRRHAPRPLLEVRARLLRRAAHSRHPVRLGARREGDPRPPVVRLRLLRTVPPGGVLRPRPDRRHSSPATAASRSRASASPARPSARTARCCGSTSARRSAATRRTASWRTWCS